MFLHRRHGPSLFQRPTSPIRAFPRPILPLAEDDMSVAQQLYDQGLRQFCKSKANRTMLWYPEAARTLTRAIEADHAFLPAYRVRLKCHQALGRSAEAAQDSATIQKLAATSPAPPPDPAAAGFYERGV